MLRRSNQITVLAILNHGVLISAHRGYIIVNPENWDNNRRAYWTIENLGNNAYRILNMVAFVGPKIS